MRLSAKNMESTLKVPKKRIAMLIGKGGETKRMLIEKGGCKSLRIDSETGDIAIIWCTPGSFYPLMMMKLPDVIKEIGKRSLYNTTIYTHPPNPYRRKDWT